MSRRTQLDMVHELVAEQFGAAAAASLDREGEWFGRVWSADGHTVDLEVKSPAAMGKPGVVTALLGRLRARSHEVRSHHTRHAARAS